MCTAPQHLARHQRPRRLRRVHEDHRPTPSSSSIRNSNPPTWLLSQTPALRHTTPPRRTRASAVRGESCVIIGAGSFGHIGIQVTAAISIVTLIVIDRNPDALALAKTLGADHTVLATSDNSFVQDILSLTSGKGLQKPSSTVVAEGGVTSTGMGMLRRAGN